MLRRPRSKYEHPILPPLTPPEDFETIDVTRLTFLLDEGVPLTFDLGEHEFDRFSINELFSEVNIGKRTIHIATSRILYYETEPVQIRRPYKPKP